MLGIAIEFRYLYIIYGSWIPFSMLFFVWLEMAKVGFYIFYFTLLLFDFYLVWPLIKCTKGVWPQHWSFCNFRCFDAKHWKSFRVSIDSPLRIAYSTRVISLLLLLLVLAQIISESKALIAPWFGGSCYDGKSRSPQTRRKSYHNQNVDNGAFPSSSGASHAAGLAFAGHALCSALSGQGGRKRCVCGEWRRAGGRSETRTRRARLTAQMYEKSGTAEKGVNVT